MIEIDRYDKSVWRPFAWCAEQFGPINPRDTRWYYGNGVFHFRDSEDAVLFVMTWR